MERKKYHVRVVEIEVLKNLPPTLSGYLYTLLPFLASGMEGRIAVSAAAVETVAAAVAAAETAAVQTDATAAAAEF